MEVIAFGGLPIVGALGFAGAFGGLSIVGALGFDGPELVAAGVLACGRFDVAGAEGLDLALGFARSVV